MSAPKEQYPDPLCGKTFEQDVMHTYGNCNCRAYNEARADERRKQAEQPRTGFIR